MSDTGGVDSLVLLSEDVCSPCGETLDQLRCNFAGVNLTVDIWSVGQRLERSGRLAEDSGPLLNLLV